MYPTLSVNPTESFWNNALDAWQNWSDATFDDEYREAILTLVEGLSRLTGYLVGVVCCWLLLQCAKTARYWLAAAVQAVPVQSGWWSAPFVEIEATQYPEACWQGISSAVSAAILDYELAWAWAAEPLE